MSLHLTDDVEFSHAGVVSVSTIYLPFNGGYETCLFFKTRPSLVVAWYPNGPCAIEGHRAFCQRDVLRHIVNTHFESLELLPEEYCKKHDLFDCWLCPHLKG